MSDPIQNHDNSEDPQSDASKAANAAQSPSPPVPPLRIVIESAPPPPPPSEEQKAKENRTERRERKRFIVECVVGFFVIVYTIVSIFLWIASRSANRIASQGVIDADRNFRIDERAWIGFSLGASSITFTYGKPFLVPTEILNTGKTPAKDVEGNVAVDVVPKGAPINFSYATGHANYLVHGGTLFPNGKIGESFEGIQHGPTKAEPIIITKTLGQEIMGGQAFVIIHGKITYRDEFGTEHWTTFCRNVSDPSAISEDCTRYNNTDNNQ